MILPRWPDHRLLVSSLACCPTWFGCIEETRACCPFFCHNIVSYICINKHWCNLNCGEEGVLQCWGIFVPICFEPKVSQNGRATDFAAVFHLSSVAIIGPKLGHKIDPRYALNERAVIWPKVIGSKSCLSDWAFAQSRARRVGRIWVTNKARNAYHVHLQWMPGCEWCASRIRPLVLLASIVL